MKIRVIKEDKDEFEFEIIGEGHTICNYLRKRLWDQKNIGYAAYSLKHPQVAEPVFFVKGQKPKKLIQSAISDMKKEIQEFNSELKNIG
ncbi:DNA-directed RNA polymerase subunit L [Candidatus Woesearchaeota archaeon]|nr:DNA-directed RNA polymerase subunit L [Candidatus Woesearchaeota archaeon]